MQYFRAFSLKLSLFATLFLGLSGPLLARSVYLNGIDVSSARNQVLSNVNVRIDEHGHVYVDAPHYQVNEEDSFTPLSSWLNNASAPKHQEAQGLRDSSHGQIGKLSHLPRLSEDDDDKSAPTEPADKSIDAKSAVAVKTDLKADKSLEGNANPPAPASPNDDAKMLDKPGSKTGE